MVSCRPGQAPAELTRTPLWSWGCRHLLSPGIAEQPHVALQPRQYRHLRAAQPVNVAFSWLFPVERHVHLARTASAAKSQAHSRDERDGRVSRRNSAAVSRTPAHGRQPVLARETVFRPEPPPGTRARHAYRGLDGQPAPGGEVGVIVGTRRSTGAGVARAPNGYGAERGRRAAAVRVRAVWTALATASAGGRRHRSVR